MIVSLADEIEEDAAQIATDYPKGATITDLAGYYGVPLAQVQQAIAALRREGVSLYFLKGEPPASMPPSLETHTIKTGVVRPGPHPNKKEKRLPEVQADAMRPGLESLARRYPYGATLNEVAEFFGLAGQHAYGAIQLLAAEGEAAWVKDGNGPNNILYVPGMMQMPPPLTQLQEAVYCAIRDIAVDGKATVNGSQIAKATGTSQGSVAQICYALELKGYVRRLTPYNYRSAKQSTPGGALVSTSPEYEVFEPTPRKPAFAKAMAKQPSFPQSTIVAKRIADDDVVKKAIARRVELVAEIDAFLDTYRDITQ